MSICGALAVHTSATVMLSEAKHLWMFFRTREMIRDVFASLRMTLMRWLWFHRVHGCLFQRLQVLNNFLDLLIAKVRLRHLLLEFPSNDFRFGMKDLFRE